MLSLFTPGKKQKCIRFETFKWLKKMFYVYAIK